MTTSQTHEGPPDENEKIRLLLAHFHATEQAQTAKVTIQHQENVTETRDSSREFTL